MIAKDQGGAERDAEWYDQSFEDHDHWRKHYSESRYYFMWNVVIDRLVRAGAQSVLDIGCGPGQVAALARDRGIKRYCGLDFSPRRIEFAKKVCPDFTFVVADACTSDLLSTHEYDGIICTEFLEHVHGDLDILARLRPGADFVGSVPNYPYASHVRYFNSAAEVLDRYRPRFSNLRVDACLANAAGKAYFILEGRIAAC